MTSAPYIRRYICEITGEISCQDSLTYRSKDSKSINLHAIRNGLMQGTSILAKTTYPADTAATPRPGAAL